MFKILIDTCVWLDLAKDAQSLALIGVLETLVKNGEVQLILPRLIVDEFSRNKARVAKEATQSLSSALKRAREAVWRLDEPKKRANLSKRLHDLDLKLPTLGETVVEGIGRIETLFSASKAFEISDAIKTRAAERALKGAAPFQRMKNSIGDAVLIEVYAEAVRAPAVKGVRFAFITHNKHDFSLAGGDHRKPHADLAPLFSKVRSLYCVTLADALKRVDASLLTAQMMISEWEQEPRSASQIIDEVGGLVDKVWYNRHQGLKVLVDLDKVRVVDKETYPRQDTVQRDIWAGALKAAKKVEKRYGLENLGPWDDFEWGMINGKLSALRWVLGDEWDMLDT